MAENGSSLVRQIAADFQTPLTQYTMAPFWFWNDQMEKPEMSRQMRLMKEAGVDEFVLHPRLGLRVKYLTDEWFDLVGFTLAEAKKLGMKVWLYDELNWPSGFAGGRVLEQYPQGRARHIVMTHIKGSDLLSNPWLMSPEGDLLVALLVSPDGKEVRDVTDQVYYYQYHIDPPTPEWSLYVIVQRLDKRNHPLAVPYMTDSLDPKVTDVFLNVTHEQYYRRFKDDFGTTILGFFTDEPGLYYNLWNQQPGSVPWTAGFLEFFEQRNGYDLKFRLPWLWENHPLAAQTRRDFWQSISDRFVEAFFAPQRRWCESRGIQFFGHLEWEEHLSTHIQYSGNLFRNMRQLHMAGVDRIDLDFHKLTEKYGSSVQHTTEGMTRTMSESFAICGWDVSLSRLRKIIDWQFIRGVNFLCPHAFFYSLRDFRKFESPPSHFFQNTFWPYFGKLSDYTKRLSYLLRSGTFEAPIAFYYPLAAAQGRYNPAQIPEAKDIDMVRMKWSNLQELEQLLQSTADAIEAIQSDFDFVDDDALAAARWESSGIDVVNQHYRAMVVIDWNTMPKATQQQAAAWAKAGGIILTLQLGDSQPLPKGKLGPNHYACKTPADVAGIIHQLGLINAELSPDVPSIRVMRRQWQESILLMLNNEGKTRKSFRVKVPEGMTAWQVDCSGGQVYALPPRRLGKISTVAQQLDESESSIVLFSPVSSACKTAVADIPQAPKTPTKPVLSLDGIWKININGQSKKSQLVPWSALGQPHFSGSADYEYNFSLSNDQAAKSLWIVFEEVREIAEVHIDQKPAGVVCWAPWRLRLPQLSPGKHTLHIKVTNSTGNRIEKRDYPSGLLGLVSLKE